MKKLKKINIQKVHKHAKLPNRANPSDAGMDVFYCPEGVDTEARNEDSEQFRAIQLRPNDNRLFGTGLRIAVPHGYMIEVKNRSSMAAKRNTVVGACVVDSGYEGEVFIDLHNLGISNVLIRPGDKIAQLVVLPIEVDFEMDEVSQEEELYKGLEVKSERGDGALGSTD